MPDTDRLHEDLPRLAGEAFQLAGQLCASCRNFHALWPYVRLSRASGAAEGSRSVIEPLLAQHFALNRRHVLIAGAADTGLLAFVARVGAGCGVHIHLVDQCGTPLELCRRFAQRWLLPIKTTQQDLADFDAKAEFDLVFVHSLLQFIAADRRAQFVSRMQRALRPDGRLIMLFRVGQRIAGDLLPAYRAGYVKWILGELERLNVPLPESSEAFGIRLNAYALAHETREGAMGDPREVMDLLEHAGFAIEKLVPVEPSLSVSFQQFESKLSKRRFVVVAKPSHVDHPSAVP
jgi:SAM-dependent methyltransferase